VLLRADPALHLTYCTNIHPADGWRATYEKIREIAPALKARICPEAPFGLGLRLGARDARELRIGDRLGDFRSFLDREGLYVALVNGFPYGPFHGEPVKTNVYAPDWRTDARVDYTFDLIAILATLLPDGMTGGISTTPLSYKAWMPSPSSSDWRAMTGNLVRVAERLVQIERDTGKSLHLDIEPEPDCTLETSTETVVYIEEWLRREGAREFGRRLGTSEDDARMQLNRHVQVCFDCCHCAVEYEDPLDAIGRLQAARIPIGRFQLSAALMVRFPSSRSDAAVTASHLRPFAESTYLHQVVEACDGTLTRYSDLDVALEHASDSPKCRSREWRIHFHVPLFTAEYDRFNSSQAVVRTVLDELKREPLTAHLEIETYTWNVLPAGLKIDLIDSIEREYRWVLDQWRKGSTV
jgi:sugar phosphate isomerase/epimerase